MAEGFQMLGELPPEEIAQKLREIGDAAAAAFYEQQATLTYLPEGLSTPRRWLDTQHQYGFIPLFEPHTNRFYPIMSATNISSDLTLVNQRINIRLDWLKIHEYPSSLFFRKDNIHTILYLGSLILISFGANLLQAESWLYISSGFLQTYARTKQSALREPSLFTQAAFTRRTACPSAASHGTTQYSVRRRYFAW